MKRAISWGMTAPSSTAVQGRHMQSTGARVTICRRKGNKRKFKRKKRTSSCQCESARTNRIVSAQLDRLSFSLSLSLRLGVFAQSVDGRAKALWMCSSSPRERESERLAPGILSKKKRKRQKKNLCLCECIYPSEFGFSRWCLGAEKRDCCLAFATLLTTLATSFSLPEFRTGNLRHTPQ